MQLRCVNLSMGCEQLFAYVKLCFLILLLLLLFQDLLLVDVGKSVVLSGSTGLSASISFVKESETSVDVCFCEFCALMS
jgi:hypothetical protein